jgi:hypothetical protein
MMATYKVKEWALYRFPQLFTTVNDVPVTLHGKDEQFEIEADANGPKRVVVKKAATQEQFKQLFDEGHPFIEKIESPAKG